MNLKIKKLKDSAVIPKRATDGSVGYDLYACLDGNIVIKPGMTVNVGTGLSLEIEEKNIGGFIFARSGLATKKGIIPANCVGVVDNDYRGEIIVALKNTSCDLYEVKNGDRVAQIIFFPTVIFDDIIVADDLSESERGIGGFGSTGNR